MTNQTNKRTYHGWIVIEPAAPGFNDYISVEWMEDGVRRHFRGVTATDEWRGESGVAQAIEWWDAHCGQAVNVEPTIRGCYRVYTLDPAEGEARGGLAENPNPEREEN